MKSLLIFIMMLYSSMQYVLATQDDNDDVKSAKEKTCSINFKNRGPLHAPARTDLLLIIEETGITIRFNGDFGPGFYQLSDTESGNMVSGLVVAEAGGTEFVSFPVSLSTSFDFFIEFEDGSWSHLAWGE